MAVVVCALIGHVVDAVAVSVVDTSETFNLVHTCADALLLHICPGYVASLLEIHT